MGDGIINSCGLLYQVGVDFAPLLYRRYDVESYKLIAHLAEVLIALVELSHLLRSTYWHLIRTAILVESGVHCHHDVLILLIIHIGSCRPAECLATHDGANHLN